MKKHSRFAVPTEADNVAREAQAQEVEAEIRKARAAHSREHYAAMRQLPGYLERRAAQARARYERDKSDPAKRAAANARAKSYYAKKSRDPEFIEKCRARSRKAWASLPVKVKAARLAEWSKARADWKASNTEP
jgi:hypothetical protein